MTHTEEAMWRGASAADLEKAFRADLAQLPVHGQDVTSRPPPPFSGPCDIPNCVVCPKGLF